MAKSENGYVTHREETTGHTDGRPAANPVAQHGALSLREEHGVTRRATIV